MTTTLPCQTTIEEITHATVGTDSARCFREITEKNEHALSYKNTVSQWLNSALNTGTAALRNVANFAFQQILNSQEMAYLCPGLKETLLTGMALSSQLQPTQAKMIKNHYFLCKNGQFFYRFTRCDGRSDCGDNSDEIGCDQNECNILDRPHHCDSSTCLHNTEVCNAIKTNVIH